MDVNVPLKRLMNADNALDRLEDLDTRTAPENSEYADFSDELSTRTGEVVTDNLYVPAEGTEVLDPTDTAYTGHFISSLGQTFSSIVAQIGGVSAGVLQWGANTSGQLVAGADAVTLDVNGISVNSDGVFVEFNNTVAGVGEIGILEMITGMGLSIVSFVSAAQLTVPDPGFEVGASDWTYTGSAARSSAQFHSGAYSGYLTASGDTIISANFIAVSNPQCMLDFWLYRTGAAANLHCEVLCYSAGSVLLGTANDVIYDIQIPSESWARFCLVGQYPATTTKVKIRFTNPNASKNIYVDDISLYDGSGYHLAAYTGSDSGAYLEGALTVKGGIVSDTGIFTNGDVTVFGDGFINGGLTVNGAASFSSNPNILNVAPSLTLYDTTASAKSLTIEVNADKADFRERTAAAASLLQLDLATNAALFAGALSIKGITTINLNSTSLPSPTTGTVLQIGQADTTANRIGMDSFAGANTLEFRRADGTNASKSALAGAATTIGQIAAFGYGSTGYSSTNRAALAIRSTQAWTDANQGTEMLFTVTPNNSTTPATVLQLGSGNAALTVGFFGVTPSVRASAYTQTYSTAARTVTSGMTVDQLAQIVNSIIDDLQAYGLAQ